MTVGEFIARHGEFAQQVDSGKVAAALADATRRTDPEVFGTSTDEAIGWLCAHLLIADPGGRAVREALGRGAQSTYLNERIRLEQECAHIWIGGVDDGC
jgi:hypothetical protein